MIDNLPISPRSKTMLLRKQYQRWRWRSKESRMLIATLFILCGGVCPECGKPMILSFNKLDNERDNSATLDHITPISRVIETSKYGMQIMCRRCNGLKGNKK